MILKSFLHMFKALCCSFTQWNSDRFIHLLAAILQIAIFTILLKNLVARVFILIDQPITQDIDLNLIVLLFIGKGFVILISLLLRDVYYLLKYGHRP